MKLLLDQNLSFKLCATLSAAFPGTAHIGQSGLADPDDDIIWLYARDNGFTVVSKDEDFVALALRYGSPPKLIMLRCGNCPTAHVENLLLGDILKLVAFDRDPRSSYIELG